MDGLGLKRDDRGLRPSRLVAVFVGLIVVSATLGVTGASAGTAGSLFPRALELGLPINAAPPAEQNVSFPRSEQHAALVSVACASAGSCVAVGDYTVNDRAGVGHEEAMAATESEGAWKSAVEIGASLDAVTCTGVGDCVGVGGGKVVTEKRGRWGAARKIHLPTNAPADTAKQNAQLDSVACTSAGNCVVAGSYQDQARRVQAVVATETRGAWGVARKIDLPANALTKAGMQRAVLDSVACTNATDCVAVGEYRDTNGSSDRQAMLATETNGAWGPASEVGLPANALTKAGKQQASLNSVACTSAGNCVAVGDYVDAEAQRVMVATETNGAWGAASEIDLPPIAVPAAARGQHGELNSVACTSAGNCVAVGDFITEPAGKQEADGEQESLLGGQEPMAVTETGGVWGTAGETVLPEDAIGGSYQESVLSSVACTNGPGECVAVGTYVNNAAPETYTGMDDGNGAMVLGQHLRRVSRRRR
jgi:cytochrome c551/c552